MLANPYGTARLGPLLQKYVGSTTFMFECLAIMRTHIKITASRLYTDDARLRDIWDSLMDEALEQMNFKPSPPSPTNPLTDIARLSHECLVSDILDFHLEDSQSGESDERRRLGSTRAKPLISAICRQSWILDVGKSHATVFIPFLTKLLVLMDNKIPFDEPQYREVFCRVLISLRFHWVGIEPPTPQEMRLPPMSCPCGDCATLSAFLRDRTMSTRQFRLNKRQRQHIRQQLDRRRDCFGVRHTTIRSREPQTLVVTKPQSIDVKIIQKWGARVKAAQDFVRKLDQDKLRMLLGENAWRAIIVRQFGVYGESGAGPERGKEARAGTVRGCMNAMGEELGLPPLERGVESPTPRG